MRLGPQHLNLGLNLNVKLFETLSEATLPLLHPRLQLLMACSDLLDGDGMCGYLSDLGVNKVGQLAAFHECLVVSLLHLIDACLQGLRLLVPFSLLLLVFIEDAIFEAVHGPLDILVHGLRILLPLERGNLLAHAVFEGFKLVLDVLERFLQCLVVRIESHDLILDLHELAGQVVEHPSLVVLYLHQVSRLSGLRFYVRDR